MKASSAGLVQITDWDLQYWGRLEEARELVPCHYDFCSVNLDCWESLRGDPLKPGRSLAFQFHQQMEE